MHVEGECVKFLKVVLDVHLHVCWFNLRSILTTSHRSEVHTGLATLET